jgi:hypothetical protein
MNFALDDKIIQNIKELEILIQQHQSSQPEQPAQYIQKRPFKQVERQNYVAVKKEKRTNFQNTHGKEISNEDWQMARAPVFKATKIEVKEGVEKNMNDIRVLLNKISNKNYETMRDAIFKEIQDCLDKNIATEDQNRIVKAIFDIASSNKFYSTIYADLYCELLTRFSFFGGEALINFLDTYKDTINNIKFVDASVDYDKFCEYTKSNEFRKSTALFIIHLMKKGVIEVQFVINILEYLQENLNIYIVEEGKVNEVDEYTEITFILMTTGIEILKNYPNWNSIYNNVETISKKKVNECISLSSRAIFKMRDLVSNLQKQSKL